MNTDRSTARARDRGALLGLLVSCAICAFVTGPGQAADTPGNLVTDPSFDRADAAFWSDVPEHITTERAHSGTRAVKLAAAEDVDAHFTRDQVVTQRIAIKPSTEYQVRAWVFVPEDFRTGDAKGNVRGAHVDVAVYDGNGKVLDPIWTVAGLPELRCETATGGRWAQLDSVFRTDPAAAFAVIRLGMADTGTAYFDDVSLEEYAGPQDDNTGDCATMAAGFKRHLAVVAAAIREEVDPFEMPRAEIDTLITEARAKIALLAEAGAKAPGPEEQTLVKQIRVHLSRLPAAPLWDFVDAKDWRPSNRKAIWIEPQSERVRASGRGIVLCVSKDMMLGASRRQNASPTVLKLTRTSFARFNRLALWVCVTGSTHQFLDIAAMPPKSRGMTDTDRNQWLKKDDWTRVVWDFHYHDEAYRSRINALYMRTQNRGAFPGEGTEQKYFITDAVLLRVKPRKCSGWAPDPTVVATTQAGYKPIGRKVALIHGDVAGDRFVLRDLTANRDVFSGRIEARQYPATSCKIADFSAFEQPGRYEIQVGEITSHPFTIAEDALRPAVDAALYFLRCDRSACDTPYHKATSLDDARRLDNGRHQDFTGGWYDAGDTYQIPGNTAKMCRAALRLHEAAGPWRVTTDPVAAMSDILLARGRIESPLRPRLGPGLWKDTDNLLEEIRWGLEFLFRHQDPSGGVYAGQTPTKLTKEEKAKMLWAWYVQSYFTDNIVGTDDDKWWNMRVRSPDSLSTFLFMDTTARAAVLFRTRAPELAARCLAAAEKAWQYSLTAPGNADGTGLSSSVEARSAAVLGCMQLYRATGNDAHRKATVAKAKGLVDLLNLSFSQIPEERITGFFWCSPRRATPFANVQHLAMPYVALSHLCRMLPDEPDWIRWYAALRISDRHYWRKLTAFHAPYRCMPGGLFSPEDVAKPLPDRGPGSLLKSFPREKFVPLGSLFLRHFSAAKARGANTWPRASNACVLQSAVALTHMALAANDPAIEQLARDQLNWLLGNNPFAVSTVTGVGADPILGMSGEAYIPGRVCYGAIGWDLVNNAPFHSRNSRAYNAMQWKEASIANSAPFIEAAGILSCPASVSGVVREKGTALAGATVTFRRGGRQLTAVTGNDGRFGPVELSAGGTWRIEAGSVHVPVTTVSGGHYDIPIDTASEIALVLTGPEVMTPGQEAEIAA